MVGAMMVGEAECLWWKAVWGYVGVEMKGEGEGVDGCQESFLLAGGPGRRPGPRSLAGEPGLLSICLGRGQI